MTAALRIIIPAPLKKRATLAERMAHRVWVITRGGEELPVLGITAEGDRVTIELFRSDVDIVSPFESVALLPVETSKKPPQKTAKAKKK